jgi:glutamine amidotransferase
VSIGILDFGAGNICSLTNALKKINKKFNLVRSIKDLSKCDKLIIPGVGSYSAAINKIKKKIPLTEIEKYSKKKYVLGICLGMQILSTRGNEGGNTPGLNLIEGEVKAIYENNKRRLSHVGWNNVKKKSKNKLLKNIKTNEEFYFVHSYQFLTKNKENIIGKTNYNSGEIIAIVQNNKVFGVQFHPEKSHNVGLQLLTNFCDL